MLAGLLLPPSDQARVQASGEMGADRHVGAQPQAHAVAQGWRDVVPQRQRAPVRTFQSRGDVGYVARVDGRFVGEIWLSRITHRDPYSGLLIRLAADEAYAYALWVDPEVRPQGVGAVLMLTMLGNVRDDPSVTRVYGWVDARNRRSQVLMRLLGFTQVQSVSGCCAASAGRSRAPPSRPTAPLSPAGRHAR